MFLFPFHFRWICGNFVNDFNAAELFKNHTSLKSCAYAYRAQFVITDCAEETATNTFVCEKPKNSATNQLITKPFLGKDRCQTSFHCSFNEFCLEGLCTCAFGYERYVW